MRAEIERFFRNYAAACNAGDAVAVASHISAPSLSIEKTTTVWSTDADALPDRESLARS
jgi:hypothetical protein